MSAGPYGGSGGRVWERVEPALPPSASPLPAKLNRPFRRVLPAAPRMRAATAPLLCSQQTTEAPKISTMDPFSHVHCHGAPASTARMRSAAVELTPLRIDANAERAWVQKGVVVCSTYVRVDCTYLGNFSLGSGKKVSGRGGTYVVCGTTRLECLDLERSHLENPDHERVRTSWSPDHELQG